MSTSVPIASLLLTITADGSQAQATFGKLSSSIGSSLSGIGGSFAAVSAVATGVAASMVYMAERAADVGAQLYKASQITGMSVEGLSALRVAVGENSGEFDNLVKGITKLDKTIDSAVGGNKKAQASFAAVGLSVNDLKSMNADQIFEKIAVSVANYGSSGQLAALMQQLFGKTGAALIPVMKTLGTEGFDAARQKAKDLGQEYTFLQAYQSIQMVKAQKDLQMSFEGIENEIGKALIPALADLMKGLQPVVTAVINFVRDNPGVVEGIAVVAAGVVLFTGAVAALTIATIALDVASGGILLALGALAAILIAAGLAFVVTTEKTKDTGDQLNKTQGHAKAAGDQFSTTKDQANALNSELGNAEQAGGKAAKGFSQASIAAAESTKNVRIFLVTLKAYGRIMFDIVSAGATIGKGLVLGTASALKEAIGAAGQMVADIDTDLKQAVDEYGHPGDLSTKDKPLPPGPSDKGKKDAEAKKQREEEFKAKEAQAKNDLAVNQFSIDQEEVQNETAYQNNLESLKKYYDERADLIARRTRIEIQEQNAIIKAATDEFINNPDATDDEKKAAQTKITEANTAIQKILNKQVLDLGKNTNEATKATKELKEQYTEFQDQLNQLNMTPFQKAQDETDKKFDDLIKKAKKLNIDNGVDKSKLNANGLTDPQQNDLDNAKKQAQTINQINELFRQRDELRANEQSIETDIEAQYESGAITRAEADKEEHDRREALRQKELEILGVLDQQQVVLQSTGYQQADIYLKIQNAHIENKKLATDANNAMKQLNDTVQTGLVSAFTDIFTMQKGIIQSFKDFGSLILDTIAKIAATALVNWLMSGGTVAGAGSGSGASGGAAGGGGAGGSVGGVFGGIINSLKGIFFGTGASSSAPNVVSGTHGTFGPSAGTHDDGGLSPMGGSVGASVGGSAASLGSMGKFAALLPVLGAGLGGMAGGQSTAGNVMGEIGGALGGAFAMSLLAPTAFSGIFGTGAIAGLLSNPITAIVGAGLLIGAVLLGKSQQRHSDEDTAHDALAQAMTDLQTIETQLDDGQITGADALTQANQVRQQFVTTTQGLKTASVRKATSDPNQYLKPINDAIADITAMAAKKDAAVIKQEQTAEVLDADTNILSSLNASILRYVGSFAVGSYSLPSDGMALVHRGEAIIPAEANPFTKGTGAFGNIHVDIHDNQIKDDVDIKKLAERVGKEIHRQFSLRKGPVF